VERHPSALELFRLGLDTVQIAARLAITEADASHLIYCQRCHERGLPIRYERAHRGAA
jgi:hypothetical protein